MIVKLTPASEDRTIWRVCIRNGDRDIPVDFTRIAEDERVFVGDQGGLFLAECEAEGWRILGRAARDYH